MNNNFKRVYAYRYTNGVTVVYGEDSNGCDMHRAYLFYDSLAEIKQKLKSEGVKNVSHMKKWAWN